MAESDKYELLEKIGKLPPLGHARLAFAFCASGPAHNVFTAPMAPMALTRDLPL